jgi:hypothetical protein
MHMLELLGPQHAGALDLLQPNALAQVDVQ